MVADISSTIALFCRSVFFIPESIIERWASTDVNRSSQNIILMSGNSLRNLLIPGVI